MKSDTLVRTILLVLTSNAVVLRSGRASELTLNTTTRISLNLTIETTENRFLTTAEQVTPYCYFFTTPVETDIIKKMRSTIGDVSETT